LLSDAEKSTRRAREIKQENVHLNMGANNSKEGCRNRSRSALRRVHPDSTDNREHMQEEIESEETEREVNTPIQEDRPPVSPLPLPPHLQLACSQCEQCEFWREFPAEAESPGVYK